MNNNFKEINETKSFKDKKNILKKIPDLGDYWGIMKTIKRKILDYLN